MNLHEYQGKQLFREYGLPVSEGFAASTPQEAVEAAADMAGIERFRIAYYPSYEKDIRDALKRIPWLKIQANWLHNSLGNEFFTVFEKVKSFGEVTGIQMRLPFVYQIN